MESSKNSAPLSFRGILDRVFDKPVDKMMTISIWHLLWIAIVFAEILTAMMNTIMGYVWWGAFSRDLVLIGTLDAFVVSLIAGSFILYIFVRLREAERAAVSERIRAAEEINKLNLDLERRVEERTAELEKRDRDYRLLMEQASDGIFITDHEGRITAVNNKACEMLGRTRDEVVGVCVVDFMQPEDLAESPLRVDEIYSGNAFLSNRRYVRKDGGIVHIESTVKMVEEGTILAIARDITERKRAEAEKESMQLQLFKAQKMEAIGTLAGGVAHDFNNLLTVIRGEAEMVLADLKETDPMYFHARQISKAAGRAVELTKKLLLFGRRQPIAPAPMDLNRTVQDMLDILGRVIGEDVSIDLSLQDGLWNVLADASGMEQVIMNLVVNARDAMPGGGTLSIGTENVALSEALCREMPESRPGEFVCLTVSDTGTGMSKEKLQHIFEPFFSASEYRKGTGLGLSVVYGIVEQHGGWMNVQSEPGRGSTFKVYLETSRESPAPEAVGPLSVEGLQGAGERVLLVEDEEGVSFFARKVLGKNGYVVLTAPDAEGALDIYEKEGGRFDLVFSDVVLPGKSGLDLVEHLLEVNPALPVILSSGYTDQKSQWPVIRERGYRFLEKPYDTYNLLRSVKEAIPAKGKGR